MSNSLWPTIVVTPLLTIVVGEYNYPQACFFPYFNNSTVRNLSNFHLVFSAILCHPFYLFVVIIIYIIIIIWLIVFRKQKIMVMAMMLNW